MSKFQDFLSTFFVTDDSIQTQAEVAAAQQAALDRQRAEGKRGLLDYWSLSREVGKAGTANRDYVDDNDNPLAIVPWWIWLAAAGAAFWYLGGFTWLRGILARRS
jgi:hypothetical protein